MADIISGTSGNDSLMTSISGLAVYGPGGNDTLSANTVTLSGGNGKDYLYNDGTLLEIVADGDDGNDQIVLSVRNSTLSGGNDNDTVRGTGNDNLLRGGNGHVSLYNSGKDSTLDAGVGYDTITGSGDNVSMFGGSGADTLYTSSSINVTLP